MNDIAILFVTCCLEEKRTNILKTVVENIKQQIPQDIIEKITVFDNASNQTGVHTMLTSTFKNVFVSNVNIGYWSAIYWWLNSLKQNPPKYTYIIESDIIHYNFYKLKDCKDYLDRHNDVGGVRLTRYSVANKHLFNKQTPNINSNRKSWISHINGPTGEQVVLSENDNNIWKANFPAHLPSLNRYQTMLNVFEKLSTQDQFTEIDFQKKYYDEYQFISILDGGLMHAELCSYDSNIPAGSWVKNNDCYHNTRNAKIVQPQLITKL